MGDHDHLSCGVALNRRGKPQPAALVVATITGAVLLVGGGLLWQQRLRPVTVAVGVDEPRVNGAVIDPSDRNSADLFLESNPRSRIRLITHFNPPDPAAALGSIAALRRRGVELFVTTQASNQAVPSLPQFADGQALAINVSAVSNALSGRHDQFLRIVPDLHGEQRAIARVLNSRPGSRLLVLQDTGNRAYTDPAFRAFAIELQRSGRWRIERRELAVAQFDANRQQKLLAGDFDALYVLAGSFMPMIGNISQLFHLQHPEAPILLTPWARSPQVAASAGPAAVRILQVSPYPARRQDRRVDAFLRRFGYTPYAMALGTHQALELLDRALTSGAQTPAEVKRFLLARPLHTTSFGPIRFDAHGDVQASYHGFNLAENQPPTPR